MKKILVTGGLGFIGSHLIKELNKEECEIHIVDNLSNNSLEPEEVKEIAENIIICDVDKYSFNKKFDEVYHLASPVGPAGVLNYAGLMGRIILNDDMLVAEYAHKNNAKVLFVSTSEVYGREPGNIAQKEDIDKTVPSNITVRLEYGVAKLLAEICIHNYALNNTFNYNIVRPFNIVGIGQSSKAGFVIPRFVQSALHNRDLTIFGDGKQRRTFTDVKDIVDAMIMIMKSEIQGEIFNIGNPANEKSIKELAEKIKEFTNSQSEIIYKDPKNVYGKHYAEAWNKIPDITKIKKLIGWKPKYDFEMILREVIEDEKTLLEKNKKRPNQE